MKSMQVSKILASTILIALSGLGCGRSDHVYSDPASTGSAVGIEKRTLPTGVIDESTGTAKASLEAAPSSTTDLVLRLQTPDGTGNRALLGINDQSETKLKTLTTVSYSAKITTGTVGPTVLMIVDLACDTAHPNLHVLTATFSDLTTAAADANGYSLSTADFDQAHWKASGAAIVDSNSTVLLSSNADSSSTAQPLTALLSQFPDACLTNTSVTSTDLATTQNAAISFSIGSADSSVASAATTVDFSTLTIGTKIIDAKVWGNQ